MSNCPYCGNHIEKEPEHVPMSFKRRAVYDYVKQGGPEGVAVAALNEKFFPASKSSTLRTTIHYINRKIEPLRIVLRGGVVRVLTRDG